MGFAAFLILIFHFYVPVTGSLAEQLFYRTSYIGVDLFFFVSACSAGQKEKISFRPFIKNRLCSVYSPFLVMTLISAIYNKWMWKKILKVVTGAELFMKSGGAFMWFIPGIMIFYLITPLLVQLKSRYGWKTFAGMIFFWALLVGIFQYGFHYTKLFILLNRIPVFAVGLFYDELRKALPRKIRLPMIVTGLVSGIFMMHKWGSFVRLGKPVEEMFYVVAVPLVITIAALFDYISQRTKVRNLPLMFMGSISLELYGLQMIFGYDIETFFLEKTGNGFLSFVCMTVVLTGLSFIFYRVRKAIIPKLLKKEITEK